MNTPSAHDPGRCLTDHDLAGAAFCEQKLVLDHEYGQIIDDEQQARIAASTLTNRLLRRQAEVEEVTTRNSFRPDASTRALESLRTAPDGVMCRLLRTWLG